jgi:hypothetical protein
LELEARTLASYFRNMKRLSFLMIIFSLCARSSLPAQDARTEERLNKLSGQIEDLIAGQEAQRKRINDLAREIESLRDQQGKQPNTSYASQEDLKRVAKSIEEVDRKRVEDYKKIEAKILDLGKILAPPGPANKKSNPPAPKDAANSEKSNSEKAAPSEKGFEYVIKSGDTISAIIQAYKEQNIKVTEKQILQANPGLVAEKLRPGQKIFIPAPQQ